MPARERCTENYLMYRGEKSKPVSQNTYSDHIIRRVAQLERDPLEMFSHFFDHGLLSDIVRETNRYAAQCLAAANSHATWTTTVEELKAYLGFMIVMGINRLPEIRDYWSTDEKMHNAFIASRITRDRFEQISRYLHLVNNTSLPSRNQPGYHRLQKVLPIITHMKQKYKENYNPHPQNSVDEAMIGYKGKNNNYHNFKCSQIHIYMHTGRSSMIQYMPMKQTKRGFKVWARADSVNGYFCDFEVYTGRATDGETTSDFGLGERVVLELTECPRGGHYQIYCDNYFSTCRLFDTLSTHQLYGCGTARPTRRQFPETLKHVRPGRGEHVFCQRGDLVASVWMDKKPVNMLSTLAQADVTHTIQKRQRDGTSAPTQCPDAVVLYNRYMAGVDKGDQYRQYYHVRTKCLKKYKYIFWFLFDVAITNAYILSTFAPTTMSISQTRLKQFRLKLAEQLVGNYNSRKALGRPPVHVPPPRAPVSCPPPPPRAVLHLPSRLQKRKRCAYCTQRRDPPRRKDTSFYCSECTDHPPLCFTGTGDGSDCFRLWHQH